MTPPRAPPPPPFPAQSACAGSKASSKGSKASKGSDAYGSDGGDAYGPKDAYAAAPTVVAVPGRPLLLSAPARSRVTDYAGEAWIALHERAVTLQLAADSACAGSPVVKVETSACKPASIAITVPMTKVRRPTPPLRAALCGACWGASAAAVVPVPRNPIPTANAPPLFLKSLCSPAPLATPCLVPAAARPCAPPPPPSPWLSRSR